MEEDWEEFFKNDDYENVEELASSTSTSSSTSSSTSNNDNMNNYDYTIRGDTPKCSDIYISTKTKISYFNKPIVLNDVFWKIPIMPYHTQAEGVIKKQMKFNSTTQEELNVIQEKVREYSDNSFIEEHVIMQIANPTGRIKFKDIRKISIGLRKKDIISHRCKKKSAFYNCFVVILRITCEGDGCNNKNPKSFREINAKVFNTGKIEIPGIQTKEMLDKVLILLTSILKKVEGYENLEYIKEKSETVLINSNFRCGYYVNREKLYSILKYKYNIKCAYDPCSYPGILCEFYYDQTLTSDKQTGRQQANEVGAGANELRAGANEVSANEVSEKVTRNKIKVSFMIFRTGSVLIVGKCEENVLNDIYLFIKNMMEREYLNCYTVITEEDMEIIKEKSLATSTSADKCRKIKKNIIVYA
jgi:hypothetical protein